LSNNQLTADVFEIRYIVIQYIFCEYRLCAICCFKFKIVQILMFVVTFQGYRRQFKFQHIYAFIFNLRELGLKYSKNKKEKTYRINLSSLIS